MNLPPFYVGQKVVCIKDHTEGIVKKGQEYIIMDIVPGCCSVDAWWVDIGYKPSPKVLYLQCPICHQISQDHLQYLAFYLFAPIEEQKFSKVTYTEILEAVEMCNN